MHATIRADVVDSWAVQHMYHEFIGCPKFWAGEAY
jgi:hypothetical protein